LGLLRCYPEPAGPEIPRNALIDVYRLLVVIGDGHQDGEPNKLFASHK
jgi:hypothetical protein